MVLIAHFSGLGVVSHPPFVVWEAVSLIIRVGANYVSFIFHNQKVHFYLKQCRNLRHASAYQIVNETKVKFIHL